jgi:hypothetical protein
MQQKWGLNKGNYRLGPWWQARLGKPQTDSHSFNELLFFGKGDFLKHMRGGWNSIENNDSEENECTLAIARHKVKLSRFSI